MSWTLGIDTSSSYLSIGLVKDGVPQLSCSRFVKNAHSEHITAAVKSVLAMVQISVQDIERCGIVTGPGSFTGLRISIAFIKGLFASGETKVTALSSLETAAFAWPIQNGKISAAYDARQGFVFGAHFIKENGTIRRISEDAKTACEEFLSASEGADMVLFDPAGNPSSPLTSGLTGKQAASLESAALASGLAAALLAHSRIDEEVWHEAVAIFPNYMQESYAERMKQS